MTPVTPVGSSRTLVRRAVHAALPAAAAHAPGAWSVCLESTDARGRFSYYAPSPVVTVTAFGAQARLAWPDGSVQTGDTLAVLDMLVHDGPRPEGADGVPWCGGLAGYVSYDFGRTIEPRARGACDDLSVPDVAFGVYDAIAVVDHARSSATLCASGWPLTHDAARAEAERRLDALEALLTRAASAPRPAASPITLHRETDYRAYAAGIARVQRAIRDGDIYQANIAQRFSGACDAAEGRAVYARLRDAAPAPYAAAVVTPDVQVFSASPELFLERRGARLTTRPIKGTRPRGATPAEDAALAAALCASEKDRAEHVMIVDVERNDVGRLAVAGGVRVEELAALESFASVHHLTSTVSATLRPAVRTSDVLRATFPSGSISGAPKLRAMEIIDEVESVRRGAYTGAIGWIGWGGDCQLSMAIRVLVVARGRLHLWVGGGIVADSRADHEYEETLVKGRALARAIGADLDAAAGGV